MHTNYYRVIYKNKKLRRRSPRPKMLRRQRKCYIYITAHSDEMSDKDGIVCDDNNEFRWYGGTFHM